MTSLKAPEPQSKLHGAPFSINDIGFTLLLPHDPWNPKFTLIPERPDWGRAMCE